jgi:hypothetical protein
MSARGRRRSPRSLRPFAAAAVLAGGLVLSSAFVGLTVQENALAREIAQLEREIASAQGDHAALAAQLAEKRSSDYVVEKAKQYGWVWPWESIIAVQRGGQNEVAVPASERPSRVARWIALFVKQ